ncbi:MAG TPA: desulfoferrodoxin [Spirochaeta sp.]|nr:desulfoferrodoxin [Spirochaeta sp.]
MAVKKEIYKCNHCGIIAEVVHGGGGKMICCGEPMELLEEKTADSTTEKHVPVIEEIDGGYRVTVGSTLHPMVDEHFIEWIELSYGSKSGKKFLAPGDEPVAEFLCGHHDNVSAREYCNLHGLWKA